MGSLNYDNAPVAEIKPPQPGHPRKEEPFLNITQRVRKILLSRAEEAGDHEHHDTSRSATSEIAFSFSASFFAARGRMDEDWPDPPTEFALQAFFVRKLSPDHLKAKAFSIMRSKIHNENRVWKHFSRFDVVRQQHKNTGDHGVEAEGENDHLDQSDDDELQLVREDVEERTVSLNCPIGGILPIKIPVYGEHCEHLQSVDLENFLDLLPQTRNPAKKWRCAICHRAMRLWDLRFCSFTYEIIEGVRMKNQGRGAGRGGGDEDPDEEEDPLLSDSFVLEEDEARVLVNADGSYSFDFEKELQKEREEKFGRAMNLDEDGDSAAKRLKKDEAEQEVQKIARVNEIASVNVSASVSEEAPAGLERSLRSDVQVQHDMDFKFLVNLLGLGDPDLLFAALFKHAPGMVLFIETQKASRAAKVLRDLDFELLRKAVFLHNHDEILRRQEREEQGSLQLPAAHHRWDNDRHVDHFDVHVVAIRNPELRDLFVVKSRQHESRIQELDATAEMKLLQQIQLHQERKAPQAEGRTASTGSAATAAQGGINLDDYDFLFRSVRLYDFEHDGNNLDLESGADVEAQETPGSDHLPALLGSKFFVPGYLYSGLHVGQARDSEVFMQTDDTSAPCPSSVTMLDGTPCWNGVKQYKEEARAGCR
eukprot:g692.t1